MKKIVKNKLFKNYIAFFLSFTIIEILFRWIAEMPLWNWAVLRITLSNHILAILFTLLIFPLKEKIGKIISIILVGLITFYAFIQTGFKNFIGVYMSLGTSSQLGAVKEYVKEFLNSFHPWFYILLIPFLLFCIYKIMIEKKLFKEYFYKEKTPFEYANWKKHSLITIGIFLLSSILYYGTLHASFMQNVLQLESTKELFKNPTNPNISVNQFGITIFGLLDIKTSFVEEKDNKVLYFEKKEETEKTDFARHIEDTLWEELNEKTANSYHKTLNNYFLSREITPKNELTGYFKDKNLIVIMMESVNEIFINEEYYPTFYKLYKEGWNFTNSYSPRNSCATGNNEMSGMTSLFTIYRRCTANDYKNNEYTKSIFNLFNQVGYKTSSFHNYTEMYYSRPIIHKNMGSNAYYGVEDLHIPYDDNYAEWPSDVDLMEEAIKRIDTENPFMAWITTVTSHQPYNIRSTHGDKYLNLFEDTEYPLSLKRYMSKLKELDLALEHLLDLLEEKGILKDTVIALYGDHYPYGLSNEEISYALPYDIEEKNNIDKTPFVIYNSETPSHSFSAYTSYINILPTLANLFDLDYDPRLFFGTDILAPEYESSYKNRVIFADGSWENSVGSYDATNGRMSYFGEKRYSKEEIISYNKEISDMIKMSNLTISTNYFKYLQDGLNALKNEKQ